MIGRGKKIHGVKFINPAALSVQETQVSVLAEYLVLARGCEIMHNHRVRRGASLSLAGCGLLRSGYPESGVYLGSIPIRGSGAVVAGYAIPVVTGE